MGMQSMTLKHGKRHLIETFYNGEIVKEDVEWESDTFTDKQYLLKKIIESLTVLTDGETTKLTIEICLDNKQRYKLTQRWRVQ